MSVSRYVLGTKIASGGMAEIYLGKRVGEDDFQRPCAIKQILSHLASNKDFIDMFRDEAHICKQLQHANIVRVEGFEEISGSYAIVMEFIEGSDLRSLLSACERADTRLTIPMTLFVATEAARGLHYAHNKRDDLTQKSLNIVHRDISPQNILVSYEGEVKVTDFGIANAKEKNTETQTGTVKGKYSYMSPEQISAEKVDRRSDIFSLGIVLWEMLAMKKLFQSRNDVSTIGRVRECKIPFSLSKKNPEISAELESIVLKCLNKKIDRRYQTAEEMEKSLRKFLYTNYSDFTASDLGNFVNERLLTKRKQTQKELKELLATPADSQLSLDTGLISPDNLQLASGQDHNYQSAPMSPPFSSVAFPGTKNKPDRSAKVMAQVTPLRADDGKRADSKPDQTRVSGKKRKKSRVPMVRDLSEETLAGYGSETVAAPRKRRSKRSRSKRQKPALLLAIVAVSVLVVAIAYIIKTSILQVPIGNFLQLKLDVTPSVVKLIIDGKKYRDGRYLQTPITLKSKKGKHRVRIFRQGYKPRSFYYQGKEGQTFEKTVVLEPATRFSTVKIISQNKRQKYLLDVNDGFFRGESPALIPDLAYYKRHVVKIFLKGGKSRSDRFNCSFMPTSYSKANPYILVIAGRSCSTVSNKR